MKRKIAVTLGLFVLLIAVGLIAVWWWMGQPMYTPGDVRAGRNLRGPLDPPAQTAKPGTWQVERDITIRHFTRGAGRNVLIVHGGPGLPAYEPYPGLEALTDACQFHYYDQRGCGGSTRPFDRFQSSNFRENLTTLEQTLGVGAQLADIERIRRILGDKRLVLIGHSFGGFLACLYAAEFPERVEAMVLVAPAGMLVMPSPTGDLFEQVRKRLCESRQAEFDAWLKRYLDFGSVFNKSESELAAEHLAFAKYYLAATRGRSAGMVTPDAKDAGGWMVRAMYFSLGRRHDYREALKAVRAPVLVVHGENDLQPEAASRSYVEALPGARLEVIHGAGHFPHIEAPEAFAAAVRAFLSGAT